MAASQTTLRLEQNSKKSRIKCRKRCEHPPLVSRYFIILLARFWRGSVVPPNVEEIQTTSPFSYVISSIRPVGESVWLISLPELHASQNGINGVPIDMEAYIHLTSSFQWYPTMHVCSDSKYVTVANSKYSTSAGVWRYVNNVPTIFSLVIEYRKLPAGLDGRPF